MANFNEYATKEIAAAYWGLDEETCFLGTILDELNKTAHQVIDVDHKASEQEAEISAAFGRDILDELPRREAVDDKLAILDSRARFVTAIRNFVNFLLKEIDKAEWKREFRVNGHEDKTLVTILTSRHGIYHLAFTPFGIFFSDRSADTKAVENGDPTFRIVKFGVGEIDVDCVYPRQYEDNFAFAFAKFVQTKFLKLNKADEEEELEW
jgi:hypothetical protein